MKKQTKAQRKAQERQDAAERIRQMLPATGPARMYGTVKHVSRSGMQRTITLYVVKDGEIYDVSHPAAEALGWAYDYQRGGIKVSGCGMDMVFHTVDTLRRVLGFPYHGLAYHRL